MWELVGNGTKCMPDDLSFFVFLILLVSMCSKWVYVFNVFFVGLTRLHRGAKPSSVMVSFYLNLVNLVIPVFLVNLLILQDVVILLNLVILLREKK